MLTTEQIAARLAHDILSRYGDDAETAATERAEALAEFGNADAARIWFAVAEIVARQRAAGERTLDGRDRRSGASGA